MSSLDGVDKRGRRVQQTSSEDLKKYYDLHDNAAKNAMMSSQQEENESGSEGGDSDASTDVEEVMALQDPEVGGGYS